MLRRLSPSLCLVSVAGLLATACTFGDPDAAARADLLQPQTSTTSHTLRSDVYTFTGSLWAVVDGVTVTADQRVWAGMGPMTCSVDGTGLVMEDVDVLTGAQERVTDHDDADDSVVVVAEGGHEVAVMGPDRRPRIEHRIPGLIEARHDGGGDVVALVDDPERGCGVAFHEDGERVMARVPVQTCPDERGFAADREARRVLVASEDGLYEVTPTEGAHRLGEATGDLLALDAAAGEAFLGAHAGREVLALDEDGARRWSQSMQDPVYGLRAAGGDLFVLTGTDDGDAVWRLDGETGEGEVVVQSTRPILDLGVRADAGQLAVVTDDEVAMFVMRR